MNSQHKIGASILSADFANLGADVKRAEQANVDYIHIDIMDGRFVEGITWGPMVIGSLRSYTSLPLDVHLMVQEPERFIKQYIDQKPNSISIHPESTFFCRKILREIRANDIKAGVALKLDNPVYDLENIIDCADYVLLLSSEEGFGGNSLSPIIMDKIDQLKSLMKKKEILIPIQLDGGVKEANIHELAKLGIEYFVLGSAIYNADNISENVERLQ